MTAVKRENLRRCSRARSVVLNYEANEPLRDNVIDLLTDLMHLCHREKLDFERLIEITRDHFTVEQHA